MKKKQTIINHYKPRISTAESHYDILDWANEESQHTRFSVLANNIELGGKSLLDIGCGLCDLWDFLNTKNITPIYTGVDIVCEMVQQAASLHPDIEIQCADLFKESLPEGWENRKFDVVFCSGMLNLDLGNSQNFTSFAIKRMAELSREYIVFNLLHHRAENKYPHCVYHDPKKILSIARKLGQPKLIDNYLPNDFTIIVKCNNRQN